ncbi:hypothetical protein Tco_0858297 [Tanacetum coccineum]|uniref:Tf2-1-like SH3-like domain-containing protein n=1 Tax=Tanacetum coccineum TaxID=301880 RepID=A0ABQ5B8T5_9ASTR
MTDKVVLIKEKLKAAKDHQKSYADNRYKPLEFEVGDQVLLKVSPWKGMIRFGKKGKLALRYVGPFEILERIGPVAYQLRFPEELSNVHDTFHMLNLKKCLADANLHVPLDEIKRGPEFTWEREDHMKAKYLRLFADCAVEPIRSDEYAYSVLVMVSWDRMGTPTVLRGFLLHRSSINNSASLCNKFGESYFIFKFGILGLLHHVVTTIADRMRGQLPGEVVYTTLLSMVCVKYSASVRKVLTSKDTEDPRWSTSIKTGSHKCHLQRWEYFGSPYCVVIVLDKNIHRFIMDDPNITMEEYIRLEEEKARRHGQTFNWKTATYGKMEYCKDEDDSFTNLETEYPAIVFDDTSDATLSCEPTTDSENENDKVNMSSSLSPEPTFGYIEDLDFFKDFENEFRAIAYNDLKTKSDPLVEPSVSSQHIDKFETSLSEYDEEEQNILYFNDSFPLDVIFPNNLKTTKDNDDNIDITHPSRSNEINIDAKRSNELPRKNHDKIKKFEGLQYTDADIADFETRLTRIYRREVHRVQGCSGAEFGEAVLDLDTAGALQFQLGGVRRRMSWREGPECLMDWDLVYGGFSGYTPSYTLIRDPMLRLCHRLIACSIAGRSQEPKKVTVTDLFYLRGMDVSSVNVPYLLARYLRLFASGRKQGAMISGGCFVARLDEQFSLLTEERLQGLRVIVRDLHVIDMAELEGDAGGVTEEAPVAPGDGDEDEEMPQAVPPPPRTKGERIARLKEEVHGMHEALQGQREVLDSMASDFSRLTTWTITSLARLIDRASVSYTRYSESPVEYQRRTRQRTDGASTSTAPQQPDP